MLNENIRNLRKQKFYLSSFGKNIHSSQNGYFACSIGKANPNTIRRYIEHQG